MNSLYVSILIVLFYLSQTLPLCSQTTLAGWDFEDQNLVADVATDGSGNLPDNLMASVQGNTAGTITFPGGIAPSPAEAFSINNWDEGEGVNICLSTENFSNLRIEFDTRSSNSGPRDFAMYYSENGEAGPFLAINDATFQSPTSFATHPMFGFTLPESCTDKENLCLQIQCVSDTNAAGNPGIGSTGTLRIDNINIISAFDNPLPVDMVSFKAYPLNNGVKLRWVTASEHSNRGFILYRTKNIYGNYQILDSYIMNTSLKGKGNSSEKTIYEYHDKHLENNIKYWYKVADVDLNGNQNMHGPVSAIPYEELNPGQNENIPDAFKLWQNFPNPFNPETLIRLDVPDFGGEDQELLLEIFALTGQKIRTLFTGSVSSGIHTFVWNGTDDWGRILPGGIYFCQVNSERYQKVNKMILIR